MWYAYLELAVKAGLQDLKVNPSSYIDRMNAVDAAGYLLMLGTEHIGLPAGIWHRATHVWRRYTPEERLEYLLAASFLEHENSFLNRPAPCVRCRRPGRWRRIILKEAVEADEWRYLRPENHVPLCEQCAYEVSWNARPDRRYLVGRIVWGKRFEALLRWHHARQKGILPPWDRRTYPLWPPEFGGSTWEEGSGHVNHASPRPPLLDETKKHQVRRMIAVQRVRKVRKRRSA